MGRHVDLDALRAQRAEASNEPPTVLFFGEAIALPVQMPFALIHAFAVDTSDTFDEAIVALIGEDHVRRVGRLGATDVDMVELMYEAAALYGASPEVSSASPNSSGTGGARSNPTSNGSTVSTLSTAPSGEGSADVGSAP